jgi:hypothetical protein
VLYLHTLGHTIKIFTARVAPHPDIPNWSEDAVRTEIQDWLEANGLPRFDVTCIKDIGLKAFYDDRAIHVERNTGRIGQGFEFDHEELI